MEGRKNRIAWFPVTIRKKDSAIRAVCGWRKASMIPVRPDATRSCSSLANSFTSQNFSSSGSQRASCGLSVRNHRVMKPRKTGGRPSKMNTQRHAANPAQWIFSKIQREMGTPSTTASGWATMNQALARDRSSARNQWDR